MYNYCFFNTGLIKKLFIIIKLFVFLLITVTTVIAGDNNDNGKGGDKSDKNSGNSNNYIEYIVNPLPTHYKQSGSECGLVTAHIWLDNINKVDPDYLFYYTGNESEMQSYIADAYNLVSGGNCEDGNCPMDPNYYDEMMEELTFDMDFAYGEIVNPSGNIAQTIKTYNIGGAIRMDVRGSTVDHIVLMVGAKVTPENDGFLPASTISKIKIFDPEEMVKPEFKDLDYFWWSADNQLYFDTDNEYICKLMYTSLKKRTLREPIITSYEIRDIYPNPGNININISYKIMTLHPVDVSINIYNLFGQKLKEISSEKQGTGEYRVIWDGSLGDGQNASSGLYFAQIIIDKNKYIKHFTLLK